ncbi:hypothetical protein DYY67_1254 [Candidatus Nitrosotalea sp. TS]|nr:hypothetical protein [Candidatus Nitrosotalea sp. TS]
MSLDPISDHTEEKEPNILNAPTGRDEDRTKWSDMGNKTTHIEKTTAIPERQSRKQRMLANEDIKRWYLNQAATSRENADVSIRRLAKFCEDHDMTPMQFIDLAMKDAKVATDLHRRPHKCNGGGGQSPQLPEEDTDNNEVMDGPLWSQDDAQDKDTKLVKHANT